MTPEERRVGMRRLAIVLALLVFTAGVVSVVCVARGATARAGLAAGFGIVGIGLGTMSLASSMRSRTRLLRPGATSAHVEVDAASSKTEFGLLVLSVGFCAASLGIG